jgi:WD40 repeat protein
VAFAPDGRSILSGAGDATVRLWDVETGKELRRFEGHTEWISGVAFSPDGRQAVTTALDRSMRLWDVETGRQIRSFSGCLTSENLVTFSPDGRRILSGSGWRPGYQHAGFDNCVRLRDVATGEVLACFEGHRAPVVTVAFSPDGRTALSAGYDNTIRLLKLPESGAGQGLTPKE